MKLERLHEYILSTVVIVAGIGFALYSGKMTGEGQSKYIMIAILGLAMVMLAIKLREQCWLLIPIASTLGGFIPALPFPFGVKELAIVYVFGVFLVLKALKVVRRKPEFDLVDLFLLLLLLHLVDTFIRNPVGLLTFGSQKIGGKPYASVVMACLGYWVLSRVTLSPWQAIWLPLWMTLVSIFDAAAGFFADHFPGLSEKLSHLYSGFATAEQISETSVGGDSEMERSGYLSGLGGTIFNAVCSYFDPATALNPIYFWRFALFTLSVTLIFFSGFRSGLIGAFLFFMVAGYFRRGWMHVIRGALLILAIGSILIIGQGRAFNLPFPIQRSLSFLPGQWDPRVTADAQDSTEWRVEMWKAALTTDRYIHDRIFGDGFGTNLIDLAGVQQAEQRGLSQYMRAEGQAIMGTFHSGPISTIRFVGYLGLVLYYLLILAMALKAGRLVMAAKGTPYFVICIFICTGIVLNPFTFTFIFGQFDSGLPSDILNIGFLKMLQTSLEDYRKSRTRVENKPGGATVDALPFVRDVRALKAEN